MKKSGLPSDVRGNLVIKAQEATGEWGYLPTERPIEEHIKFGILNLDKPAGPTSHEIVAWVKRILSLKKAGHGGTLEFCKGIAE